MPYDGPLADRLRTLLADAPDLSEKHMFGGIAFLVRGNMCCGVHKNESILRLDPAAEPTAVKGLRPMDLTGKPMRGWFTLSAESSSRTTTLTPLVHAALAFAQSLPPKPGHATTPKRAKPKPTTSSPQHRDRNRTGSSPGKPRR